MSAHRPDQTGQASRGMLLASWRSMAGSKWRLVEQTLTDILTLAEGLDQAALLRSRLTRAQVHGQLLTIADALQALSVDHVESAPELNWRGWITARVELASDQLETRNAALWAAVSALVPETLIWLRVYRDQRPSFFEE